MTVFQAEIGTDRRVRISMSETHERNLHICSRQCSRQWKRDCWFKLM